LQELNLSSRIGHQPFDELDEPQTQTPTGRARELFAPAREERRDVGGAHSPVVPAGSVTGRSLTLVISIMCFLACLTAGAVYMINQSADAWLRDVASEVTVQILPREGVNIEKNLQEVAVFLTRQKGVETTRTLSAQTSKKLLEPWLGQFDAFDELPIPRLIAVQLNRDAPPNFEVLSKELSNKFQGVTLDDHRQWQRQIKTVTRSLALGGIAILLLVGAATTAIIVSATRSAMASNREIVEVLHFVGATDGFIAREFEKHFLNLGIRAGILGAASAMAVFFLMPYITLLLGGGSMTEIELSRLIGSGTLDLAGYVLLGIVVIVTAALCMVTSRFGVYRILNSNPD
jgi:cell division transport system permease protein